MPDTSRRAWREIGRQPRKQPFGGQTVWLAAENRLGNVGGQVRDRLADGQSMRWIRAAAAARTSLNFDTLDPIKPVLRPSTRMSRRASYRYNCGTQ
jgi:hypothetical protein